MNHQKICAVIFSLLLAAAPNAFADDNCDLAKTVATKASSSFKNDQADGIRLYTKALELCPDSAVLTYNLGTAYYIYGRADMATAYLTKAVQLDTNKAQWFNNLAAVLLQTNGNTGEAVQYAAKASELQPNSASIQDTYARAVLADGDTWQALNSIKEAHAKWSDNINITATYDAILERYLSDYLQKIKAGDVDTGLAGLKRVNFSTRAIKIYLLALNRSGYGKEALAEAAAARKKSPESSELTEVFAEIMEGMTRSFYQDYQAGNSARAVTSAKKLAGLYPAD